ncbi:uncharacterized protein LOC120664695 isoform X1 [Panicum virgatum]|uniref:uncharacterized protein LOC120664695 isoform X1 n=1 Tax=Panicum virgatum TaxID=38727 RepID=UPI0019D66ED5|nr:uncharacterized protein LOC120664695 isoform X1 [Panicum virgatum]
MENGGGTKRRLPEMVMCSTCSGFVLRNKRKPNPDEEVVAEAEKMRDMLRAVLLHGPLQMVEPAEATRKQRQILQRRRRILVETKRCPACSGSPLELCPTRFCSLLAKKPRPDEEDKAMMMVADPRSKAGSKSSREEVSEFVALLWSDGGKEISTEDEAMVADAKSSEHKLKRSREEGSGSSKKKAKRSNEVEGSGSKEAEMEGSGSIDKVLIEGIVESVGGGMKTKVQVRRVLKKVIEILDKPPVKIEREEPIKEDIELPGGDRKTMMVTQRLDEKCIDLLKNRPRPKPIPYDKYLTNRRTIDAITAMDKVDRLFHGYLQYQSIIKGYAEYQLEVPDDEGDDWKLV